MLYKVNTYFLQLLQTDGNNQPKSRKPSILPDILRSVTLEEIIQAVDIVTEEEGEARVREEAKQQHWNIGTLEAAKGSVFLEGAENYLDDT